jgi:phosphatidylinositol alpha-1,6-mannosyltransferase
MPKVLIVTNDFPPRAGGIQSFVHALAVRLPAGSVSVYAPAWEGAAEFDAALPFPVERHHTSLMLPVPSVARRAARLLDRGGCDTVLFGAAAPLGLLAPSLRRAGVRRLVAITHGHEAGWAVLPAARGLLRRIGDSVDTVTYLGEYTRVRLARALSPAAAAQMTRLAPGVDSGAFRPGVGGAALRERLGLGGRPVVICVSRLVPRKGQDTLIRAWPAGSAWPGRSSSPDPCRGPSCPPTTTPGTCSRCPAAPAGMAWTSKVSASSTWRRPRPACP